MSDERLKRFAAEAVSGRLNKITLEHFELESGTLGSGANGFAVAATLKPVHDAEFPTLAGKRVAIKYLFNLSTDRQNTARLLDRLAKEARILHNLFGLNPHVQQLYGWFSVAQDFDMINRHFLTRHKEPMKPVDCELYGPQTICVVSTLYNMVLSSNIAAHHGRSFMHNIPNAATHLPQLMSDVRDGVNFLVSRRVSHLDIKSDNIGVVQTGANTFCAVIIDFGEAVQHGDDSMLIPVQNNVLGNSDVLPPSLISGFDQLAVTRCYKDADFFSVMKMELELVNDELKRQREQNDKLRTRLDALETAEAEARHVVCCAVGSSLVGKSTLAQRLEASSAGSADDENDKKVLVRKYKDQDSPEVLRKFLRGAGVFLCCFSKADKGSFDEVRSKWLPKLKDWTGAASGKKQVVMLVMCKSDTEEPQVTREEAIQLTKDVTAQLKPVRVRGPFLVSSYQEDTIMNLQQTLFSEHEMLSK